MPQRRGQPGSIQITGTSLDSSGIAGEWRATHAGCTGVKDFMDMKSGESFKTNTHCTVGLDSHVHSFFIASFT